MNTYANLKAITLGPIGGDIYKNFGEASYVSVSPKRWLFSCFAFEKLNQLKQRSWKVNLEERRKARVEGLGSRIKRISL